MIVLSTRLSAERRPASGRLVLPFEVRSRSRFRARLQSGEAVGVQLPRGEILRGGDQLLASDGRVIEVAAANEEVSTVRGEDGAQLARAAYHLGNRHVPLQIGAGWIRYGHDHVLDDMVRGLGLAVSIEAAPFEPEAGAYPAHAGAAHEHSHD
ncbi:MAG TPA: urease accessory protein UreE [Steroidobacteraceae bacterium]|nr:urease accessory protein UreE [Steroidobacteraceae bacterium]